MNVLNAKDFRHRAWNALSGKWGALVIITLVYSLVGAALSGLSIIGVGAIALLVVVGPLELGLMQCYLKVVRGGTPQISELFDGFKNFLKAFLLYLINTIFIALWSILFVIPGIVKSYSYSMSYFILIDNPDMDANEARKRSMAMMQGYKWRLFCLDLSFIGWMLLTLLTFGILSFWVIPYTGVARAEFYEELLREHGVVPRAQSGEASGASQSTGTSGQGAPAQNGDADPFGGFGAGSSSANGASDADKSLNADKSLDVDKPFNADDL